jgi:hypothetical protein
MKVSQMSGLAHSVWLSMVFWFGPAIALAGQEADTSCEPFRNPEISAEAHADGVAVPISVSGGLIVVDAMIEGSGPFPMLLDTAGVDAVTPETAASIGLRIEDSGVVVRGAAGHTLSAASANVRAIRLSDAQMIDQPFLVLSLPRALVDRGARPPVDGVLGYQLFTNFVVQLDYQKHLMTLTRPQGFRYAGSGVCVPLLLTERVPAIMAEADGIRGLFAIDTGATGSLVLSRTFVDRNRLEERHSAGLRIKNVGVDGSFERVLTRLDRLDIANSTIVRPLSQFGSQKEGMSTMEVSGSIGSKVLRQFLITFDYSRNELCFDRSPAFGSKITGGAAGFQALKVSGPNFEVVNVIADTPAAAAGIKVGDVITKIDHTPAATVGNADLADLMDRPDGTEVHLRVTRSGSERLLTLILRELVP